MQEKRETVPEWIGKYKHILLLAVLCAVVLFAKSKAGERLAEVFSEKESETPAVIVIDAGHGGVDPGKVGQSGILEKDINLAIALKLKSRLQADGIQVVMTREDDDGLYSEGASNKKREDLEARVRIISEAEPEFVVSIHQNSYPAGDCKGAQVFYYGESAESKALAEIIQNKFPEILQDGNKRQAKANNDYYLLRKTACPIVIAECGFLSNASEEELLASAEYQEKVAEVLYQGILQYRSGTTGQ